MKAEKKEGLKRGVRREHTGAGGALWTQSCEKRNGLKGPGVDFL